MAISKQDYEDRQAKVEAGTADDEDRRQISLYESDLAAGRTAPEPSAPSAPEREAAPVVDDHTAGRSRPTSRDTSRDKK